MLRRMYLVYMTIGRTFGAWFSSLVTGLFLVFLQLLVSVGLALDHIFFPGLRKIRIKSPIVIVGNPRTGTTFLQRFLVGQGLGVGMEVWRMLYPSLTLQVLIKPLLPLLEKVSPARHHGTEAHKTSLSSVEVDDPSIMFRYFDGFFLYGFLLAWAQRDYIEMFDPRNRDTSRRDFRWFERMWKRNLLANGSDRVLAKVFSIAARLPTFLERFPDARILLMLRDPMSTVPSTMSLITGVLDKRYGFWKLPRQQRQMYIDRLYKALLLLTRRMHDDYVAGRIPADRFRIVHYGRMMADFEGLMDEILEFIEVEPDDRLKAEIRRTGEKQRAYVSKHKYDLERFGLEERRIREDYAFFYKTFDVPWARERST